MPTLWLFDIEPHEQRYTSEWQVYLPAQIAAAMNNYAHDDWQLEVISGESDDHVLPDGAFLNFAATNIYKSSQVAEFARLIQEGYVGEGDRVFFADAWHPGVISVRYMSDLLNLGLSIRVIWHAGSYDPWDTLGQKIKNKAWSYSFERAVYSAAGKSYFATEYHKRKFLKKIRPADQSKAMVVGWPMEYLDETLSDLAGFGPKDTILFPHRIAPEKQPEILKLLEPLLPEYRVCFAQKQRLTKAQYHEELARSIAVFSASRQETLGIGVFEGLLAGAVPIVPDRLAYSEIYQHRCYPSEWTLSLEDAEQHAEPLVSFIRKSIATHSANSRRATLNGAKRFFEGSKLYASLLR